MLCVADMYMMNHPILPLILLALILFVWYKDINTGFSNTVVFMSVCYSLLFSIFTIYQYYYNIWEGLRNITKEISSIYFFVLDIEKRAGVTDFIKSMSSIISILIAPIFYYLKGRLWKNKDCQKLKTEEMNGQLMMVESKDGRMVSYPNLPDLKALNLPDDRSIDIMAIRIHAKSK